MPLVASQSHGSVMVTDTGFVGWAPEQTVQSFTVTVKPGGRWLGPGVQVGVASVQLSVMVCVTGTRPVEHSDKYSVV